jgi:signal peptidase I
VRTRKRSEAQLEQGMSLTVKTKRSGGWREVFTIVVHALILAFCIRVFFYQPFNIPSGSMQATLLVGDYLFVSKLSYGYSQYSFPRRLEFSLLGIPISIPLMPESMTFSGRYFAALPKRGDVAVFKLPRDNTTDYIKRVIGLPGEVIEMRNGVLFINSKEVPKRYVDDFVRMEADSFGNGTTRRSKRFQETLPEGKTYYVLDDEPGGPYDTVGPFKVPDNHYFMMGDNRDNSTDSREQSRRGGVGFVPYDNLVGRADIIFFSAAVDEPNTFRLTRPWTWPFDIRWNRFFNIIR